MLFCKLCIHFYLCKINLSSCHSYSVRFTWNITPIATQGTTMSFFYPSISLFKQLSCPLTCINEVNFTHTVCKSRTDDKLHRDCNTWAKRSKTYNISAFHGKENTESQFCSPLFSQLPIFDLLNSLHVDSKVLQ